MFNVNYNLRQPSSKEETAIHAIIRYNNFRLVFPIGLKINPKYWDIANHQARQTSKFEIFPEFNRNLESVKNSITESYMRYLNENDNNPPTVEELRELLKEKIRPEMAAEKVDDFITYYDRYIVKLVNKINPKTGQFIAAKTIQGHARTVELLKEFKAKIPFEKVNLDFYHDFIEFLKTKHSFSTNTIGKHIKTVKTVLIEASEDYEKVFVSKRFKSFSQETTAIYLNEAELEAIEKLDLTNNKKLSKVRDFFLLGCWTGLRFSDLLKLKPENLSNDSIQLKAQKTNKTFVTPILHPSRRILDHYFYEGKQGVPSGISNQKLNKYVKELGKLLPELHVKITVEETKGNMKVTKELSKYEMMSSHTARRSFATNQFKSGAGIASIMAATGHKTQTEFFRYIRMSPDEHVQQLINNYNSKLKIVK